MHVDRILRLGALAVAAWLSGSPCLADVAPLPIPFDGTCVCYLECPGAQSGPSAVPASEAGFGVVPGGGPFYSVHFLLPAGAPGTVGSDDPCTQAAGVAFALPSASASITPNELTRRFCRNGGTGAPACPTAASCAVDPICVWPYAHPDGGF